ncbi:MAG: hypothetical protein IKI75_07050 [Lachnospiraceae bacterium]|nr:hypothetical protein [Lachnospiraceae bacterium]
MNDDAEASDEEEADDEAEAEEVEDAEEADEAEEAVEAEEEEAEEADVTEDAPEEDDDVDPEGAPTDGVLSIVAKSLAGDSADDAVAGAWEWDYAAADTRIDAPAGATIANIQAKPNDSDNWSLRAMQKALLTTKVGTGKEIPANRLTLRVQETKTVNNVAQASEDFKDVDWYVIPYADYAANADDTLTAAWTKLNTSEEGNAMGNGLSFFVNSDGVLSLSGPADKTWGSVEQFAGADTPDDKTDDVYQFRPAGYVLRAERRTPDSDLTIAKKRVDFGLGVKISSVDLGEWAPINKIDKDTAAGDKYNLTFATAKNGYEVKKDSGLNVVKPIVMTLLNNHGNTTLHNVSFEFLSYDDIAERLTPYYLGAGVAPYDDVLANPFKVYGMAVINDGQPNDGAAIPEFQYLNGDDEFSFSLEGFDAEAKTFINSGKQTVTMTVQPTDTLKARATESGVPKPYKAIIMMNADELPIGGFPIAQIQFTVDPKFNINLNDDVEPVVLHSEADEFGVTLAAMNKAVEATHGANFGANSWFDIGTYKANNIVEDNIKLTVAGTSNAEAYWASGITTNGDLPGGAAVDGLVLEREEVNGNYPNLTISGYIPAEAWTSLLATRNNDNISAAGAVVTAGTGIMVAGKAAVPAAGDNPAVPAKPAYRYDTNTGEIVYYIPFKVWDKKGNTENIFGRLKVKPAEISVTVDKTAMGDVTEWTGAWYNFGAENAVVTESQYPVIFTIKNENTKDIDVYVSLEGSKKSANGGDAEDYAAGAFDIIDPNADDEESLMLETITIKAGESKTLTVRPKKALVDPGAGNNDVYTADLSFAGYKAVENDKGFAEFDTTLTYNLYHPNEVTFTSPINQATPDAYKVDLTTTDSVYYDSTKYDTALENGDHTYGRLEVSKGEEKIWYLKTIGGAGADVTYSLVTDLGEFNTAFTAAGNGDDLEKLPNNYMTGTGELASWSLAFDSTTGFIKANKPVKAPTEGTWLIGVKAVRGNSAVDANVGYAIYQITLTENRKAIELYDGNKKLYNGTDMNNHTDVDWATAANGVVYNLTNVSKERNLEMSAYVSDRTAGKKTIEVKNVTNAELKDVYVKVSNVKKVDFAGLTVNADTYSEDAPEKYANNPFAAWNGAYTDVDKSGTYNAGDVCYYTNLGNLEAGVSKTFDINLKAYDGDKNDGWGNLPVDAAKTAGTYSMVVEVYADGAPRESFVTILDLKKAPTILSFEKQNDNTEDADDQYINYGARWMGGTNVAAYNNYWLNGKIGEKLGKKLDDKGNYGIQLLAMTAGNDSYDDANNTPDEDNLPDLTNPRAQFTWSAMPGSKLPPADEITMNAAGIISGTPKTAETYYLLVRVDDLTDQTVGYMEIVIDVPGNSGAAVYGGINRIVSTAEGIIPTSRDKVCIFPGAVRGDVVDPEKYTYTYNVYNTSVLNSDPKVFEKLTNVKVDVIDIPGLEGHEGDSAHFAAEITGNNEIPANATGKLSFTVTAKTADTAGTYIAEVMISADQLAPLYFPVFWVVTEKLSMKDVNISAHVGEELDITMDTYGAGVLYSDGTNFSLTKESDDFVLLQNDTAAAELNKYLRGEYYNQFVRYWMMVSNDDPDNRSLKDIVAGLAKMGIFVAVDADAPEGVVIHNQTITDTAADYNIIKAASDKNFLNTYFMGALETDTFVNANPAVEIVYYGNGSNIARDSRVNSFYAPRLRGGGVYNFTVSANVPAVYNNGGDVIIMPEQYVEAKVTITVTESKDVYVPADTDGKNPNADDNRYSSSTYAADVEAGTIDDYYRVDSITFRNAADDYSAVAKAGQDYYYGKFWKRDFVVESREDVPLTATAKIVDKADPTKASTEFVFANMDADAQAANYVTYANIGTGFEISACTYNQGTGERQAVGTSKALRILLAPGLKAGVHEATLVIEGTGFKTIEIPLSFTVEEDTYSIAVSGRPNIDTVDYAVLSETDTLEAKKIAADPKDADGVSDDIGFLRIWATGNKNTTIVKVMELTSDGRALETLVPDRKLSLISFEKQDDVTWINQPGATYDADATKPIATLIPVESAAAPGGRTTNAPAAAEHAYNYTEHIADQYITVPLKIRNIKEADEDTVTIRIWYKTGAADSAVATRDVKVHFVAYDQIAEDEVNITPDEKPVNKVTTEPVLEGYGSDENVLVFTVTNNAGTDSSDGTKTIYNLRATVDATDEFEIVELPYESLVPGAPATFTVKPKNNIPAGQHFTTVHFYADNMTEVTREIVYNLYEGDTFESDALVRDNLDAGVVLLKGWNERLGNTLAAMADADGDHDNDSETAYANYRVKKVDGGFDTVDKGYLINLNKNDEVYDVWIYCDAVNKLHVVRLEDSDMVSKTRSITYPDGKVGESFKTLTFNMLMVVDYDISSAELISDKHGNLIVGGVEYGPVNTDDSNAQNNFVDKYYPTTAQRGALGFINEDYDTANTKIKPASWLAKAAGKWFIRYYVYYGETLAESTGYLPVSAETDDQHFNGWVVRKNPVEVTDTTAIETDYTNDRPYKNNAGAVAQIAANTLQQDLILRWHVHKYAMTDDDSKTISGNVAGVEWTWVGNQVDGYDRAYVTLTCVDPTGCPIADKGAFKIDAAVTPKEIKGTCTQPGYYEYTAEAVYTKVGMTYTATTTGRQKAEGEGHEWKYDWANVTWDTTDPRNAIAFVRKECVSPYHNENLDEARIVTVSCNAVFIGTEVGCETDGTGYYEATFTDEGQVPQEDIDAGRNVVSENAPVVKATGHKWKVDSCSMNGSYEAGPSDGYMNLVCENDETHTLTVNVPMQNISLEEKDEQNATYKLSYTIVDPINGEQALIGYYTFGHYAWTKVDVEWVATYEDTAETAKATFHLVRDDDPANVISVNAAKIEIVTASSNDVQKTFRATATYAGFNFEDIYVAMNHEHAWDIVKDSWEWKSNGTLAGTSAAATFFCTVGKENKVVGATVEVTKENEKIVTYKATVKDPSGKSEYTDYYTWDKVKGEGKRGQGGIDIGEGIVVEGIEEEYYYTGKAIKPAFIVVDEARGVVLAEKVDYTVKYTNNKNAGTASIEIKGKGNYTGTAGTVTFEIKSATEGIDTTTLATVKKIKIASKSADKANMVYCGEKLYPTTVEVTTKDAGVITFTYEGDGEYSSTATDKTVVLTFSNNINKGTAAVAATGADGKTKAATWTIAAADYSKVSAEDLNVEVLNADDIQWGKKGAQAKVAVTYKDLELNEGADYKLTYKNNKKVGGATVVISGKNNFKGKVEQSFQVKAFDLSSVESFATTAAAGVKGKSVKVTIVDGNGDVIPAANYSVAVTKDGAAVTDKLVAGETYTVTVTAKKDVLTGSISKDVTVGTDIKKAKATVNVSKTFTGERIYLEDTDWENIVVNLKGVGTLAYGTDFEVVDASANLKKGTMTVYIEGTGTYSGTAKVKVKINSKPMQ